MKPNIEGDNVRINVVTIFKSYKISSYVTLLCDFMKLWFQHNGLVKNKFYYSVLVSRTLHKKEFIPKVGKRITVEDMHVRNCTGVEEICSIWLVGYIYMC